MFRKVWEKIKPKATTVLIVVLWVGYVINSFTDLRAHHLLYQRQEQIEQDYLELLQEMDELLQKTNENLEQLKAVIAVISD